MAHSITLSIRFQLTLISWWCKFIDLYRIGHKILVCWQQETGLTSDLSVQLLGSLARFPAILSFHVDRSFNSLHYFRLIYVRLFTQVKTSCEINGLWFTNCILLQTARLNRITLTRNSHPTGLRRPKVKATSAGNEGGTPAPSATLAPSTDSSSPPVAPSAANSPSAERLQPNRIEAAPVPVSASSKGQCPMKFYWQPGRRNSSISNWVKSSNVQLLLPPRQVFNCLQAWQKPLPLPHLLVRKPSWLPTMTCPVAAGIQVQATTSFQGKH